MEMLGMHLNLVAKRYSQLTILRGRNSLAKNIHTYHVTRILIGGLTYMAIVPRCFTHKDTCEDMSGSRD